jgi:hypothetical protein
LDRSSHNKFYFCFSIALSIPILEDSVQQDENNPIRKSSLSLLDLPTELIIFIIKLLPKSPYHKCLSVCRRLDEIENGCIPERSALCICRLHRHSPNLPSQQLNLRICMHTEQCRLDVFIGIIKRRPTTCMIKITGEDRHVKVFKQYLKKHDDHPNVKCFLVHCEPEVISI